MVVDDGGEEECCERKEGEEGAEFEVGVGIGDVEVVIAFGDDDCLEGVVGIEYFDGFTIEKCLPSRVIILSNDNH